MYIKLSCQDSTNWDKKSELFACISAHSEEGNNTKMFCFHLTPFLSMRREGQHPEGEQLMLLFAQLAA